jgi:D-alanyl-lipoteichoic acid acyltransferase DltB (MBOAT superfamily)
MGGNRVSVPRKYFNLMATMLIGGLWHGAAWTFVVWGGLHGLYLIAERWATRQLFAQWRFWKTTIGKILLAWITFLCVCFAWVFFRGESFEQSWRILSAMFGFDSSVVSVVKAKETVLVTVFSILGIHWMLRDTTLEAVVQKIPTFLWILVNVAMLIMIITMRGQDQAFIYFQF